MFERPTANFASLPNASTNSAKFLASANLTLQDLSSVAAINDMRAKCAALRAEGQGLDNPMMSHYAHLGVEFLDSAARARKFSLSLNQKVF